MTHIRQLFAPVKQYIALVVAVMVLLPAASVANALSPQSTSATVLVYSVPTGLKSTARTDTSVTLSWTKSNVPRYRVQVYSKPDMSDSAFFRFTDSTAEIKNLVKSTTYQFRVRGISDDGVSLTPYSAPISATTAATPAYTVPAGFKSTARTDTSVTLSWTKSNVPRYRVQVYSKPDMSDSAFFRFTDSTAEIKNLVKSTTYQFRVRGISDDGVSLTPYSAPISATTAATPVYAVPAGLTAVALVHSSANVAWKPVPSAPGYRVQVYSKPDMSDSKFTRFTSSSGSITGLKPATLYFARVRVIGAAGENLTAYSSSVKFTTPVDPFPTPTGFSASATHRTVNLSWNPVPNAPGYRLAIATKADMSDATWHRYAGTTRVERRGFNPSTTYYFRVRVIDGGGESLSGYTPVLSTKTLPEPPPPPLENPLTVASFNVTCANCISEDEENVHALLWADRRGVVVETIKSKMPDVLGIQEASQAWLDEAGYVGGLAQFEDLQQRLKSSGAPYELTNTHRNNCVNSKTPTDCVYQNRGASQGTKIFYNSRTVEVVRSGSVALPASFVPENRRYFAWAVVRQRSTGKLFFFGDTHLSSSKAEGFYELRKRQAEAVVAEIKAQNTDGLPVIVAGDLNSNKWLEPSNAPYDVLTSSGLFDPLGNDYKQEFPSMVATAENRVNAHINSWNGLEKVPRAHANPAANGTNIDYILTSKMRVSKWETVAKLDAAGNYTGIFPSDHNMILATVGLP